MATAVSNPKGSPVPAAAQEHGGVDVLRPVRYTASLVKGVAGGLLGGMATYGRKGMWAGLGLGIFVGIGTGAVIGTAFMMAVGGFAIGAGLGALGGAITGAYKNATLEHRRTKYADEVLERQQARSDREARTQSRPSASPQDRSSQHRAASNYNFERSLQQERENDRDYNSYWQDHVDGSRSGGGRGL